MFNRQKSNTQVDEIAQCDAQVELYETVHLLRLTDSLIVSKCE